MALDTKSKNRIATEGGCYFLGGVFLIIVSLTIDPTTLPNGPAGPALLGLIFILHSVFCLWDYYSDEIDE